MPEAIIHVKTAATLEAALHSHIPLSKAMGIVVSQFDGQSLELQAPLAPNINHQGSAFGGSLTAISALTGWGMVQLQLGLMGVTGNTVVGQADSIFLQPVFQHLICRAQLPEGFADFQARLTQNGKASIQLVSEVVENNAVAMRASSKFFVRLTT